MTEPILKVETDVQAAPATVWRALTARKSAMFMGAEVDSDWRPGSPISFTGEYNGKPFKDHGEIRDSEPEQRLAFTHYSPNSGRPDVPENYNLVEVRLEPRGDSQTLVSLCQTPLGGERPGEQTVETFRKNWQMMLEGLRKAAEERAFVQD